MRTRNGFFEVTTQHLWQFPKDVINISNFLQNKKGSTHEISTSLIKINKHLIAIPLSIQFN